MSTNKLSPVSSVRQRGSSTHVASRLHHASCRLVATHSTHDRRQILFSERSAVTTGPDVKRTVNYARDDFGQPALTVPLVYITETTTPATLGPLLCHPVASPTMTRTEEIATFSLCAFSSPKGGSPWLHVSRPRAARVTIPPLTIESHQHHSVPCPVAKCKPDHWSMGSLHGGPVTHTPSRLLP